MKKVLATLVSLLFAASVFAQTGVQTKEAKKNVGQEKKIEVQQKVEVKKEVKKEEKAQKQEQK
ncbi:MAG TPA: hypothetical protein PLU42_04860, partial [Spirochaetota bacterium]|nr:hypothetical protein [Spirochaetota bacterium]